MLQNGCVYVTPVYNTRMYTIEMILFVAAMGVSVGAYGASVWSSIKRPPTTKNSARTLPSTTK